MIVADAEGNVSTEFAKIILPKTADISSLKVMNYFLYMMIEIFAYLAILIFALTVKII